MKNAPRLSRKRVSGNCGESQNPQFEDAVQAVTAHPAHFSQKKTPGDEAGRKTARS
jgi:hypothetical protein